MFKATTLAAAAIASATAFAAPALTVGYSDIDSGDLSAKLTWEGSGQVTVQRAESASGPWSDKGTASSGSWIDSSTVVSKTYWYRLNDGSSTSDAVKFAAVRKLPASEGTVVSQCTAYWADTRTAESVFDGRIDNFETGFCDAKSTTTETPTPKVGVDFGSATYYVALVRFYPRKQGSETSYGESSGAIVYGSANDGASEMAVDTLGTALTEPTAFAAHEWQLREVANPAAYRTYYYAGVAGGQMTECEFYGWTQSDIEAAGAGDLPLTVERTAEDDVTAKLSWSASGEATVERRNGAAGSWTEIGTTSAGTYTDSSAPYGVACQYRVSVGGTRTVTATFTRMRRLSTAGATFFTNGTLYDGRAPERAFDGETAKPNIFEVTESPSKAIKLGVDFGAATNYVAYIRVYPRADLPTRTTGFTLYGSADDAAASTAADASGDVRLTDALAETTVAKWYPVSVNPSAVAAYRTYYGYNIAEHGNVAELELYGWTEDDIADAGGESGEGDAATAKDSDLAVASVADDDFTAKLSWTALSGAVKLQASYSATGPWADLANIANEAAIGAARENREKITNADLTEAFERV
ncbi:MAG: hypothetical protein J6V72_11975, partial [Kiritimatiellae bacterium]|nr:hypothetical protein [Kiritimatiellia bacterium]